MTKMDKALEIWNSMSIIERYEIMEKIKYTKNINHRFRACIDYIIKTLD
jgi:hypothetical protein